MDLGLKRNTLNLIIFTSTTILLIFVFFLVFLIEEQIVSEKKEHVMVEKPNYHLNYTPDSKFLVVNTEKKIQVFEVKTGKKIKEVVIYNEPFLAFSPDSKSIAYTD